MNIKQTIFSMVGLLTAMGLLALTPISIVAAANKCGGVDTAIISCSQDNGGKTVKDNGVWGILLIAINIMTAGVGVAAVGGLLYAGIIYATASNDQAKVVKAKDTIYNVVLGLVMFALMWSFLQFLVPGGIFKP